MYVIFTQHDAPYILFPQPKASKEVRHFRSRYTEKPQVCFCFFFGQMCFSASIGPKNGQQKIA